MDNTVFIVDDDASILFTATRALRKLPIAVCPTNSGYEALDWLATREVAVIVTDCPIESSTAPAKSRSAVPDVESVPTNGSTRSH